MNPGGGAILPTDKSFGCGAGGTSGSMDDAVLSPQWLFGTMAGRGASSTPASDALKPTSSNVRIPQRLPRNPPLPLVTRRGGDRARVAVRTRRHAERTGSDRARRRRLAASQVLAAEERGCCGSSEAGAVGTWARPGRSRAAAGWAGWVAGGGDERRRRRSGQGPMGAGRAGACGGSGRTATVVPRCLRRAL